MIKAVKQNVAFSAVFYLVSAVSIVLYAVGLAVDNGRYALLSMLLFAFSTVAGAFTLTHNTPKDFARKAMYVNAAVLFSAFVLLVIQLTFFSRHTDVYTDVQNGFTDPREYYLAHYVNLVPFNTISNLYIDNMDGEGISQAYILYNMLGNIFILSPTALLLPALFKRMNNVWLYVITVFLSSCLIETLQLATMRGSCDVDDVILNTAGAMLVMGILKIPCISKTVKKLLRQD
ncbi:MAG: VanZ family protein [Clostridia bacterium]|nr:VanZ family protein [Clostridia bacterium]